MLMIHQDTVGMTASDDPWENLLGPFTGAWLVMLRPWSFMLSKNKAVY